MGPNASIFLAGAKYQNWYNFLYVGSILFGAVASLDAIISLIDGMYAMMAIPTMISAFWLAPKVMEAAKKYFASMGKAS